LVAFVVVLFGEVMPKVWATQNNLQFAYYTSGIVEIVHLLSAGSASGPFKIRRPGKILWQQKIGIQPGEAGL